jgi:hypothetical protein
MLSTILKYEVEMLVPDVVGCPRWRVKGVFTPDYDIEDRPIQKRFLWWTWDKSCAVILNEKKARTSARRRAFKLAKKLHPDYCARVFVIFKFPEVDEPIRHCVWENGRYYSTH